jgi:hypothetical protein
VQFLDQILYHQSFETIFIKGHITELTKRLPFSFHLERAIFMEASHEDNHGLPYAQAFAYLLYTYAEFPRNWIETLLLGQGEKHELSGTPDL